MQSKNTATLKETKPHGTASFRCAFYQSSSEEESLIVKHHWHDEIEIVYFAKGEFHMEINMERYEICEECLYFISAGELHFIKAEGSFEEEAVVFNPQVLSFDSYDLVQSQLIRPLLNGRLRFPRCICASDEVYPEVFKEYQQIREAFSKDQERKSGISQRADTLMEQLMIKASLLKILAVMTQRSLLTLQEKNSNQQVEEIKKILTYIQSNYKEKIYIRDLAGIINVNEQYFCRFFKKIIGKSPMEYVNEIRIKNAVELLLGTNIPVMDVCLESGFNNLGNFLREFKKHIGTTPLSYRKENR